MNRQKTLSRAIVNFESLPQKYPTHLHTSEFWEMLGRTIATFGFLENVLARAIFAFTATREYPQDEIDAAFSKWIPTLEAAVTDQLYNLAEKYGKSVKENSARTINNVDELVLEIKEFAQTRNVLCHGFWGKPDNNGGTVPFFLIGKWKNFQIRSIHFIFQSTEKDSQIEL